MIGGKMMNLNKLLSGAKKYENKSELKNIIEKIDFFDEYRLDWDEKAGEEWARFFNINSEIVLMFNVKICIVFMRKELISTPIYDLLSDLLIVEVENFSSENWCIDISKIENDLPEIKWRASKEVVNTEKMSLQDLYYATV